MGDTWNGQATVNGGGFMGRLGHTLKSLGQAGLSAPGAVWDIATYATPGDQWGKADDGGYAGVGGLLDNIGGRFLDAIDPIGLGYDKPIGEGFNKSMEGLSWAYHEGVDQPLSTAWQVVGGSPDAHQWFSSENWSNAYKIAEDQSFGQTVVNSFSDPTGIGAKGQYAGQTKTVQNPDGSTSTVPVTPFSDSDFTKSHPFLANASAFGVDLTASWFLDPAVIAGKGAGALNEAYGMGKIYHAEDFASQLDGGLAAVKKSKLGIKLDGPDMSKRFEKFFDFASTGGKTGDAAAPLNAAEIRYTFPALAQSAEGRGISTAMADALRLNDPEQRINAAKNVFAVAAGDFSAVDRLSTEVAGGKALKDTLENIASQNTVALAEQALNEARTADPAFRVRFDQQIQNLDEGDDVTKFVKDWHAQVSQKLSGDSNLLGTAGGLDYMPSQRPNTAGRLRTVRGESALDKVEQAHDAVAKPLSRFGEQDAYHTIYQRGLYSLPVAISYPARMVAASSPTKLIPEFVNGLRQTKLTGFVNLHDWDSAVDQLDSLMRVGGVENRTRLDALSNAMKARSESERQLAITSVEKVAIEGLRQRVLAKHGFDISPAMLKQIMTEGGNARARNGAAFAGGREFASTRSPDEIAQRTKGIMASRQADAMDAKVATERDKLLLRVDQISDHTGSPVAMPLVSSQLANRVPLFDIERANKLASDAAWTKRFAEHGEMYDDLATDLNGLQARLANARGSQQAFLGRQIRNKRMMMDAVLEAANFSSRWWKMSVLFRLGYPMRVLADDHMRIASRLGYLPFLGANLPEGFRNSLYNYLPGGALSGGTRRGEATAAYIQDQQRRDQLRLALGRKDAHTDAEWDELKELHKTHLDGVSAPEVKAAAKARADEIDPDGYVREFRELTGDVKSASAAIRVHERNIARWREEDAPGNAAKIKATEDKIVDRRGQIDQATQQLSGRLDPDEARAELRQTQLRLRQGTKSYRPDKKHVGMEPVKLSDEHTASAAFGDGNSAYYGVTSSAGTFDALVNDGSATLYNQLASGHFRTVGPHEAGYYHLWASILNHQMQHSPEYMSIIKGGVKTPQEFAAWVRKPENAHLRERVQHFAHDPEDWGGRLLAVVEDYLPTQELQDMVAAGRVTPKKLEQMFPADGAKGIKPPNVHGQLADMQSGRIMGARALSGGINKAFSYLSEVPTDRLSRHPFFNAVYQREVKAAYATRTAEGTGTFTQADLTAIEGIARRKALKELQRTLWDVSAHSQTAHVLRFLSPFFAAHQEALSRWWGLAKENPAIVRRFQLTFDAPRKAGLVVNDKGEPVKPGESISVHNKIMLQVPFADGNNGVNKFLRELGGGKPWQINENGLNLILQNGVANPGVGPVVTIPMEIAAQKLPEATRFVKAARVLNQYPPSAVGAKDIAIAQIEPAWAKRLLAYAQGQSNPEFFDSYMRNYTDGLTAWNLAHGNRAPNEAQERKIRDRASDLAHRDLLLMAGSNLFGFTPAKPGSRYAVVQNGLARLREQQRQEGHDFDWLRDTFSAQYGEAYMSMLATEGTNADNLDVTTGTVAAMKNHRSLLDHIDPKLTRMVIGPEAARDAQRNGDMGVYSPEARGYLRGQATSPTSGQTYLGAKSLQDASLSIVAQQGWRQYDELTNYLDVQADQMGLSGYEASPQLVAAKKAGLDYIKANNPIFAKDFGSGYQGSDYDSKLNDMRTIASNKKLASDPSRTDIYWLSQYIGLRDSVTQTLKERIASGGHSTLSAKSNDDLARAFRAGVDYINGAAGSYWRDYSYHGIIENDPYLVIDGQYDEGN